MISNRSHKFRSRRLDFENVYEKARQLKTFCCECARTSRLIRFIYEKFWIMLEQHAGAGAAGRDHVVAIPKSGDHLSGHAPRGASIAGIVGGLAAAGLIRHNDFATCVFKQFDRCEPYARPKKIDEASHEQAYAELAFRWRIGSHGHRRGAGATTLYRAKMQGKSKTAEAERLVGTRAVSSEEGGEHRAPVRSAD